MSSELLAVRVARKTMETDTICRVELVPVAETILPAFTAGSHIDVFLPGGFVRQYSLSNNPSENYRYVIGVLRESTSRGGSLAMHHAVAEGDCLQISAPRNHFELAEDAEEHLLFAGGIGITPILSMARHLNSTGRSYKMHYCTRSRASTAFFETLSAPEFTSHVVHYYGDGADSQKLELGRAFGTPRQGVHIYTCGPKGFMDWVLDTARKRGWPKSQLHYEFFAGETVDLSDAGSFEVKIASTGQVIPVTAEQTVTQALALCGIEIQTSCEQGICGTCLTRVLEGIPEHKDMYMTDEEQALNNQFTPCCSRSRSPMLVLDL